MTTCLPIRTDEWRGRGRWRADSAPPLLRAVHGWLTVALNDTSLFQGWHGWHQDGPAQLGRYHKVFVLVSKEGSTAPSSAEAAAHTNLVAAHMGARYALNCKEWLRDQNWQVCGHAQAAFIPRAWALVRVREPTEVSSVTGEACMRGVDATRRHLLLS